MCDVFISYSHADRRRAEVLAHSLEAQGLAMWWDDELRKGRYAPQIEAEIEWLSGNPALARTSKIGMAVQNYLLCVRKR